MKSFFKHYSPHLIYVLIFLLLISFYFLPFFKGQVLVQEDVLASQAIQSEIQDYRQSGDLILWTNALFSGMPAFLIWVPYSSNITTHIIDFINVLMPPAIGYLILCFLGMFILLTCLKTSPIIAFLGGFAYTFLSYHFIIIAAGHTNKLMAISFFGFIICSLVLLRQKKWTAGFLLGCIAWALEIRSNHLQMTYYIGILFLIIIIAIGIEQKAAWRKINRPEYLKFKTYAFLCILVGCLINASLLFSTYDYSQESIRGKSSLLAERNSFEGLDKDYAFLWSYGIAESFTFLVPNAYGGASNMPFPDDSAIAKAMQKESIPNFQEFLKQVPSYWGEQPSTNGPIYFGVVILFLFFFLIRVKKIPYKRPLLIVIALSLLMAWGNHIGFISDFFFDYIPFYNKFRAFSSVLTLTFFCLIIYTCLAFDRWIKDYELQDDKRAFQKKAFKTLKWITGIFVSLLLLFIIFPKSLFAFVNAQEWDQYESYRWFIHALIEDRKDLFVADSWRALIFILLLVGFIVLLIKQKIPKPFFLIGILALVIIDLWSVNNRYVNEKNFIEPQYLDSYAQPTQVDMIIQSDTDPHYRVFDFTGGAYGTPNPFSNPQASYFHKSIGGYHAAKLRLYQDLLDVHFSEGISKDVLDMLNAKYFIHDDTLRQSVSIKPNENAAGNAWFVKGVDYRETELENINYLYSIDLKEKAVLRMQDSLQVQGLNPGYDPEASIALTSYHPDTLKYRYQSKENAFAVFSEIYYSSGWNMYIDGKKHPYFRCDYLLRGSVLPKGEHQVTFIFEPNSYWIGEKISFFFSAFWLSVLAFSGYRFYAKQKKINK